MNWNSKKICVLVVSALAMIVNQVYCGEKEGSSCKKYETKSCCTPSHYRKFCGDRKKVETLIRGEFLYWKSTLCGLEEVFGDTTIEIENTPLKKINTMTEEDKRLDFKWRAGFRVGADLLYNCADLGIDWTHFHGRCDYRECTEYGNWTLKYDVVDFTLGYNFYPCSHFCVKPFIGLRAANIHQNLRSHIKSFRTDPEADPIFLTIILDRCDKVRFHGVGPEVGTEVNLYLGYDFSLYCMFGAVTYYCNVDIESRRTDDLSKTVFNNNYNRERYFEGIGTDGSIGIRWDKYINCNLHLMLKFGLEQHRIYNFNNLLPGGLLSLDGAVAEAGIGFRF